MATLKDLPRELLTQILEDLRFAEDYPRPDRLADITAALRCRQTYMACREFQWKHLELKTNEGLLQAFWAIQYNPAVAEHVQSVSFEGARPISTYPPLKDMFEAIELESQHGPRQVRQWKGQYRACPNEEKLQMLKDPFGLLTFILDKCTSLQSLWLAEATTEVVSLVLRESGRDRQIRYLGLVEGYNFEALTENCHLDALCRLDVGANGTLATIRKHRTYPLPSIRERAIDVELNCQSGVPRLASSLSLDIRSLLIRFGCMHSSGAPEDSFLASLVQVCPAVRCLTLDVEHGTDSSLAEVMALKLPLQELTIRGFYETETWEPFLESLPDTLRELNIAGFPCHLVVPNCMQPLIDLFGGAVETCQPLRQGIYLPHLKRLNIWPRSASAQGDIQALVLKIAGNLDELEMICSRRGICFSRPFIPTVIEGPRLKNARFPGFLAFAESSSREDSSCFR